MEVKVLSLKMCKLVMVLSVWEQALVFIKVSVPRAFKSLYHLGNLQLPPTLLEGQPVVEMDIPQWPEDSVLRAGPPTPVLAARREAPRQVTAPKHCLSGPADPTAARSRLCVWHSLAGPGTCDTLVHCGFPFVT